MRPLSAARPALVLAAALALAGPAVATAPAGHAATRASAAEPAITIAVKSTQVERGKKVVVTGVVRSTKVSKVALQHKRKGSPWKTQATAAVRANGTYRVKDKTTKAVIRKYRVISAAGPRKKSAKVTVGVYAWRDMTKLKARAMHGWGVEKAVDINATSYRPAFRGWVNPYYSPPVVDFNVNRDCIALRARFGLGDTSDLAGRATISVLSDDVAVYSKSFGITQSEYVTVPLGAPFRVGLTYTIENAAGLPTPPGAVPVAAQPRLLCTSSR